MSTTERAAYVFRVSEYADGTPWISLEPRNGGLNICKGGMLGFDLPEGTGFRQAQEIARYLQQHLGDLGYTSP